MTVRSERALHAAVGALYAAALDATGAGWEAALDAVSPLIAAGGPVGVTFADGDGGIARVHHARMNPADTVRYLTHYAHIDPVLEPALVDARPGTLLLSDALIPRRALRRTEFHADWLRPRDFEVGAAVALVRQRTATATFYAVRYRRAGAFRVGDVRALTQLVPHLAAAAALTLRLAALHAERDLGRDLLAASPDAVLAVDGDGRVHYANPAAERLLARGDGLALERAAGGGMGRLRASTPGATVALRVRVAAAARLTDAAGVGVSGAGPLALERPSGARPWTAVIAPLSPSSRAADAPARGFGAFGDTAARARVLLHVSAPGSGGRGARHAQLRARYGLTPAEANVALAVGAGEGLAAVAALLGVGLATVRTQAQQAYRKTGVRGQAGLTRLVERIEQGS